MSTGTPDLAVTIAGVELKNPVIAASGTFGFGREYGEFYDLSVLGAIAVKGLTPRPRAGNPPPRIAETPMGVLNSIGLQNPGIERFISDEIPFLRRFDTKIIANISGNTVDEYADMTGRVSDADVDLIELNISCPNVKEGGLAFGASCHSVTQVVAAAKKRAKKPMLVKLTPNVADIAEIAKAAEAAGADGLSLINTILGMRINTKTRRPILGSVTGGLSGPAVFPVAVRMVWQVKNAVNLPVIGMGGIRSGENAAEMMLAGADAVAVGTATLTDPMAPVRILAEFIKYLADSGVPKASMLTGGVILS